MITDISRILRGIAVVLSRLSVSRLRIVIFDAVALLIIFCSIIAVAAVIAVRRTAVSGIFSGRTGTTEDFSSACPVTFLPLYYF